MRSKTIAAITIWLLAFTATAWTMADPLTVATDGAVYAPGDTVFITGTVGVSDNVSIRVLHGDLILLNVTAETDVEGNFSMEYPLPPDALPGEYRILANVNGENAEAEFLVQEGPCGLADQLLSMLETRKEEVEVLFDNLDDDDKEIPEEAEETFELAEEAAEEARELYEEGNCTAASEKATDALNLYHEAAELALEAEPQITSKELEDDDDGDEEADRAVGLYEAISRAYRFLERVNETTDRLKEKGYNVSEVREMLIEANSTLTEAESLLEQGNITGAADKKAAARQMLGRAMGLLHSMYRGDRVEKASKFLEKTEKRLQRMEERVLGILSGLTVPPEAVQGITQAFNKAQQRLQEARGMLEEGNYDDAMDEIEGLLEESNDALDEVDHGRGNKIRAIQRIEAKIEYLNRTLQSLRSQGTNVSHLEDLLNQATALLQDAYDGLEAGRIDEVEELIDEAEELAEEVEEHLDDLEEELEDLDKEHEERMEELSELRDEIQELNGEIQKLRQRVRRLSGQGVNVTELEGYIDEAERLIDEATDSIEELDEDEVEELLERIEELIEQAKDIEEELSEPEGEGPP